MLGLLAGLFLGWSLGANDAANCFGTAVSSRMVSWRHAAILAAAFVVTGAILQGQGGLETLQALTTADGAAAGRAALAAALTMSALTLLRLPASASQAVVGAYVGSGLVAGQVNLAPLAKVVACWVGTPIGAMLFAAVLYHLLRWPLRRRRPSLFVLDRVLHGGLIVCGCYSAHALGASNVANVASFLVRTGSMTPPTAVALGGLAMAIGVLTFSRGVMLTVGRGITPLDAFAALVVVLAAALTVHLYALLGVPVSTTQAMVGAVLGIGLAKGVHILNLRSLARVLAAWIVAPLGAAGLGALFAALA
ncbi:MAG: inorganic phosphate transporter [Lentisphaerae bacterium]|nr:inorganic phosphate transporter [Lentisphaerota bacterium]